MFHEYWFVIDCDEISARLSILLETYTMSPLVIKNGSTLVPFEYVQIKRV